MLWLDEFSESFMLFEIRSKDLGKYAFILRTFVDLIATGVFSSVTDFFHLVTPVFLLCINSGDH